MLSFFSELPVPRALNLNRQFGFLRRERSFPPEYEVARISVVVVRACFAGDVMLQTSTPQIQMLLEGVRRTSGCRSTGAVVAPSKLVITQVAKLMTMDESAAGALSMC
jgi:hypothetical protein